MLPVKTWEIKVSFDICLGQVMHGRGTRLIGDHTHLIHIALPRGETGKLAKAFGKPEFWW